MTSRMLSIIYDRIHPSEFPISEQSLDEIDEALSHAAKSRNLPHYNERQCAIVDEFIDDLLDLRLELHKC